ncbi:MAG: class I SAM-dependent rRNA methyltransferase [Acholeplasmatales bacterium]|jgi:23S rRNA (cytosine1962-C5)-methyltransferase|nr:class I SAM-dependent rRNA methyltransferase [Acholeplasmatales bacterium]
MYTVILKKSEEKDILLGNRLHIFANEVLKIEGKAENGSVAKVLAYDSRFICIGFINHASKMLVRILSFKEEEIDYNFFYNRISSANERRTKLGFTNNYRVVFSDADLLPGLIIDKYGDYLVVSINSLGYEVKKQIILDVLISIFSPKCIYEKSDAFIRAKEGLKETKDVLYGVLDKDFVIEENNIKFSLNLEESQKTGHFLDQAANRLKIRQYAKGKRVLDLFCNTGGFTLNAIYSGASYVLSVDISPKALDTLTNNAKMNNLECNTKEIDVFDFLKEENTIKNTYDCIILDPPAFVKNVDSINSGYNAYVNLNKLALKICKSNGILFTFSCSEHMSITLFLKMIKEAALKAKRNVRLLEILVQNTDHSPSLNLESGFYLKGLVLHVE